MVFTFNASTREVLEQVVREPRFQELARLPVFAPMEIGLGMAAFALFGLGTWLYVTNSIHFVLMLLINSFAIYVSFTPLHDATHRSVSSNRKVNDWIGTICCLLLLPGITTRVYRYLHLEHHRFAGSKTKDPDEPFVSSHPALLPFVLAGLDVLWSVWYIKHWSTRPASERAEFALGIAFYIGVHLVFLLSPYALAFILCFMIPQRFGLFYVSWFFAHIQHPEGVEWESAPFQTTVLVKTNWLAHRLLLGQSFHCLHHFAPSIPYYRYHKAWRLGEHLFENQGIPTRTLWRESADLQLAQHAAPNWLSAKVTKIEKVANETNAYQLEPSDAQRWPGFTAGAHVDVKLPGGLVRQYSLCNAPADEQRYRIAVKLDAAGKGGSIAMHSQVQLGDSLDISPPRNNFPLSQGFNHYVLLAGGIGITPLLAMSYALHAAGQSFELHLFARSSAELAFRDALLNLEFADSVQLHNTTSRAATDTLIQDAVAPYQENSGLYLCGPSGFMARAMEIANQAGWPNEAIFSESFVPPAADSAQNTAFEVKLASTGEVLSVAKDEHLIDVLHHHGYAVMCSCTQGICGSCITGVIEGVPEHRDAIMSDAQRASNRVMTVCVSRAQSERLVLDL